MQIQFPIASRCSNQFDPVYSVEVREYQLRNLRLHAANFGQGLPFLILILFVVKQLLICTGIVTQTVVHMKLRGHWPAGFLRSERFNRAVVVATGLEFRPVRLDFRELLVQNLLVEARDLLWLGRRGGTLLLEATVADLLVEAEERRGAPVTL